MNRELKFKIWDSNKKEFYKPTHEAYKGNLSELFIGMKGGLVEHNMRGITHESAIDNKLIIMQYTGRKDKKDVEIYEDDWCRAEFRTREGIQVIQGRIIMDEFMWCIDCTKGAGGEIFSINRPHNFEVIDNIHANPGLCS